MFAFKDDNEIMHKKECKKSAKFTTLNTVIPLRYVGKFRVIMAGAPLPKSWIRFREVLMHFCVSALALSLFTCTQWETVFVFDEGFVKFPR